MVTLGTKPHKIPGHNKSTRGQEAQTMTWKVNGKKITVTRIDHTGADARPFVEQGFSSSQEMAAQVINEKAAKAIKRLAKKLGTK
jgi:hypothetical protein